MLRSRSALALMAAVTLTAPMVASAIAAPPVAAKKPVKNDYHGVTVTDDYQWMEDWSNPEVKAWSKAENEAARQFLDGLPEMGPIRKRVTELMSADSVRYSGLVYRHQQLFALKTQPPKQQPFIVVMAWDGTPLKPDAAKVVVDPNQLDPKGGTSIDWFVPSFDGKFVAVSLAQGGSEAGDVHVFDAATGKETGEVIPRVNGGTAGGDLAWDSDGKGFYYTRYPRGSERPEKDKDFYVQVYHHTLGQPTEQDRYEIGKDFPRIAEVLLETTPAGGAVLCSVQNGDGGEFAHYVRGENGSWTQLTTFKDKVVSASLGKSNDVFLISRDHAPKGKVLRLQLATPTLKSASVIVPEDPSASIETSFADRKGVVVARHSIYVVDQVGGPNRVRRFSHVGEAQMAPVAPPVSAVEQIVPTEKEDVLVLTESFTQPPAWSEFRAASGDLVKTPLAMTSPVSFDDCEVIRETATSKDGTKVPMTILRRKGTKLDGSNPTLLWGYGGYGVNETPGFRPSWRVWLDAGGVRVVANIRGGGEMGEEWHTSGNLTHKQNVFDDFAACAQRLIELKYCTHEKLALIGGSNGGLLMGAMITQHPDLARAVVSSVGIYDMLRVELAPNGEFNTTEFGTVKNEEQFKALHAYSPYHHVVDGTAYPAIYMATGENDPRVDPMHSRKMIARLQAASSSKAPILLRTSGNTGHGIGSPLSARIEEQTDIYTFLFHELGMTYTGPSGAGAPSAAAGK